LQAQWLFPTGRMRVETCCKRTVSFILASMLLFRSLGWAFLFSLLIFVAHWLPLLPGPGGAAGPIKAISGFVCAFDLLALLLWPVALLGLVFAIRLGVTATATSSRWRPHCCTAMLVASSWPVIAGANQQVVQHWLRPLAIRTVVQRGQLLVHALARYQHQYQRFPAHLMELVPDQLRQLPTPGLLGAPAFAYRTRPDNGWDEVLGTTFPETPLLPRLKCRLFYSPVFVAEQDGTSSSEARHAVGLPNWYFTTYDPPPGLGMTMLPDPLPPPAGDTRK